MTNVHADELNKGIYARFSLTYQSDGQKNNALEVDLALPEQGIIAIFGHSGSGKTSLLRCIAGLERAQQGKLQVNGENWQSDSQFIPTHQRPIGYVFQESSLFNHFTAEGNLTYAIKRAWQPVSDNFYQQVIKVMGINTLLKRYPQQLSGGECQRVAIARALLMQPKLLLMDEPLASLDFARKQEILPYLAKLPVIFNLPILYVSHSVDEVARLADHVVVLNQGKLSAQGKVTEVFSRLDLPFDNAQDVGVVLQGKIIERDQQWHLMRVSCNGCDFWLRDNDEELGQNLRVRVLARDVSLTLCAQQDSSIVNRLSAEVVEITDDSDIAMSLVRLKAGNEFLIARLTRRSVEQLQLSNGKKVWAQIKSVAIVC